MAVDTQEEMVAADVGNTQKETAAAGGGDGGIDCPDEGLEAMETENKARVQLPYINLVPQQYQQLWAKIVEEAPEVVLVVTEEMIGMIDW